MNEQKLINDIFELCSSKVNERFSLFSQIKDCETEEILAENILGNIDYRSEVLLYGVSVTIRLQFFYNCESLGEALTHLYENAQKERIVDFFNEVGNLTGGKVKEVLLGQGIVTALSLPMCVATNKSKTIVVEEVLPNFKYFQIRHRNNNIFSSKISIEIHDVNKFSNFDIAYSKSDFQDGDVDFF